MRTHPDATASIVGFSKIINHKNSKIQFDDRMSSRMVKCAGNLSEDGFIGWMMNIPREGLVQMQIFGSSEIDDNDLKWVAEKTAIFTNDVQLSNAEDLHFLYEIAMPMNNLMERKMGFGEHHAESSNEKEELIWPTSYSTQFSEIIRALKENGAIYCAILGAATSSEQQKCKNKLYESWDGRSNSLKEYVGTPVRARLLLCLPNHPSIRIKTILSAAIPGIQLRYIGKMEDSTSCEVWEHPLRDASVLPDYAARIMLMEPIINETIVGIDTCDEPQPDLPIRHENTKADRSLILGKAKGTSGQSREVSIGEIDLKRHVEIIGQTGTGKSTLLATMILQAIQNNYPCTFLDPHGSTIDLILRSVPAQYAEKIRVVRIGDSEHPVPLNYWDSGDPDKEERNISDLCELFGNIFDPHNDGIVGPRYERWLSTFAKASLALLGRRASLESIAVLSQSKDNMLKLSKAIISKYPDLVQIIKEEYGKDNSNDFNATLSWYLCKFQRLTSVEQLRKTLGAGTNALNFPENIDKNVVTLIDLASPEIGSHAARIIGTMILVKLWNAIMTRKDRSKTHLLFLDEAQIYCRTNPLPRMMAESRKFGLSIVLCHQHEGQLTTEMRESLEANSANLIAFRLSPKDAITTGARLDDGSVKFNLSRLDAFKAITTLSVDGIQTSPFTLNIERVTEDASGESTAKRIEKRSIETLVDPFMSIKALTPREIIRILDQKSTQTESNARSTSSTYSPLAYDRTTAVPDPAWLEQWKQEKRKLRDAV